MRSVDGIFVERVMEIATRQGKNSNFDKVELYDLLYDCDNIKLVLFLKEEIRNLEPNWRSYDTFLTKLDRCEKISHFFPLTDFQFLIRNKIEFLNETDTSTPEVPRIR